MSASSKPQPPSGANPRRSNKEISRKENSPLGTAMPSTSSSSSRQPLAAAVRPDPDRSRSSRLSPTAAPISARAAVRKPPNGSPSATNVAAVGASDSSADDDARAQSAATIRELHDRLRVAEQATDDYQKQMTLLQSRLHDSLDDQGKLEGTIQELTGSIESRDNERRDSLRSRRELELLHETDRAISERAIEEAKLREEHLVETVQRLKDSLAQKESRTAAARSSEADSDTQPPSDPQFAPPSAYSGHQHDPYELLQDRDKTIEALRLELADAQIRLIEMESAGGTQVQELERILVESRMDNARLTEENDSFQLLLGEKTLNGDLAHSEILQRSCSDSNTTSAIQITSLADELELSGDDDEGTRKFKIQIATLREENKALSLYINNIIARVLAYDMDSVLDKDPAANTTVRSPEKDLPPPPPPASDSDDGKNEGFLARTRSIMGGARRPRPQSMFLSSDAGAMPPTPHENPATAPSIPLARAQPRSTSGGVVSARRADWLPPAPGRAASPTRPSDPLSPAAVATSPRSSSFLTQQRPSLSSRVTSTSSSLPAPIDEEDAAASPRRRNRDSKLDSSSEDGSASPPVAAAAASSVMVGSKMRPLRLVRRADDEMAARKAANRGSWMGWLNGRVGMPQGQQGL